MLLQQLLEKIMRKKKFSKLVSSCQYYCLLGTVHTTSSAGGFDYDKTTKNGVFSHAAPPHHKLALKHKKKRTQAVRILEFS